MTRRDLIVVAVLGTAMFVGVGYATFKAETDPDRGPSWARAQREKAQAREFSRMRNLFRRSIEDWPAPPGLKPAGSDRRIAGKVALVDKQAGVLDEAHMQLPSAMLAASPEQVGAVAWLEWGTRPAVTYASGDKGFVQTCSLTVVDLNDGLVLARQEFEGPAPPEAKQIGSGDQHGAKPVEAVLNFLVARLEQAPAEGAAPARDEG